MYLFSNDVRIDDRILYFDLDTVLVGSIDPLMEFDGKFAILRDFYRARKRPQALDFGSGVMAWQGGAAWSHKVWENFYGNWKGNVKTGGGDQKYLMKAIAANDVTFWQDYTDGVISYKAHVRDSMPKDIVPDGARVICFHGNPRPLDVKNLSWMKQHWN